MAALTAWQALVETADVQGRPARSSPAPRAGSDTSPFRSPRAAAPSTFSSPRFAPTRLSTPANRSSTTSSVRSTSSWTWPAPRPRWAPCHHARRWLVIAVTSGCGPCQPGGRRPRQLHAHRADRAGLEAITELADRGRLHVHVAQPLAAGADRTGARPRRRTGQAKLVSGSTERLPGDFIDAPLPQLRAEAGREARPACNGRDAARDHARSPPKRSRGGPHE